MDTSGNKANIARARCGVSCLSILNALFNISDCRCPWSGEQLGLAPNESSFLKSLIISLVTWINSITHFPLLLKIVLTTLSSVCESEMQKASRLGGKTYPLFTKPRKKISCVWTIMHYHFVACYLVTDWNSCSLAVSKATVPYDSAGRMGGSDLTYD